MSGGDGRRRAAGGCSPSAAPRCRSPPAQRPESPRPLVMAKVRGFRMIVEQGEKPKAGQTHDSSHAHLHRIPRRGWPINRRPFYTVRSKSACGTARKRSFSGGLRRHVPRPRNAALDRSENSCAKQNCYNPFVCSFHAHGDRLREGIEVRPRPLLPDPGAGGEGLRPDLHRPLYEPLEEPPPVRRRARVPAGGRLARGLEVRPAGAIRAASARARRAGDSPSSSSAPWPSSRPTWCASERRRRTRPLAPPESPHPADAASAADMMGREPKRRPSRTQKSKTAAPNSRVRSIDLTQTTRGRAIPRCSWRPRSPTVEGPRWRPDGAGRDRGPALSDLESDRPRHACRESPGCEQPPAE